MDWSRIRYFRPDEFRCSHTGLVDMVEEFVVRLDALRAAYGKPMRITSGYRHPTHPIEAAKPRPGAHSMGRAADIAVTGADAHRLIPLAVAYGMTGIGVSLAPSGPRFVHLDDVPIGLDPPRPNVWSY